MISDDMRSMRVARNRSDRAINIERLRRRFLLVWPLWVMLIPTFVLLMLFNYYPMYGISIAFRDYNPALGFTQSPWVGLKHFRWLARAMGFWQVLRNTVVISVTKLLSLQVAAIVLALMLNEARSVLFQRTIQSMIYLPHFLSWVVLGGILVQMLGEFGVVNQLLVRIGLTKEPIIFLGSNKWFVPTLLLTHLWQQAGWATILYLAALTSIDPQLYEAAAIDGASRWQRMLHITLPGLKPTAVLILCLNLGQILNAGFDQVLNLYNPAVYRTGDILDTYIYREGLISAKFSLATAVGLVKSVLGFLLVLTSLRLISRHTDYRVF